MSNASEYQIDLGQKVRSIILRTPFWGQGDGLTSGHLTEIQRPQQKPYLRSFSGFGAPNRL
jgi:hypothetical protein